jgi:hypothetical protein
VTFPDAEPVPEDEAGKMYKAWDIYRMPRPAAARWLLSLPCIQVPPEFVGRVFQEYIMPLTKDVEVEYLLHRLDDPEWAQI